MPSLDWQAFGALPGAATHNWELLCRELVRRHYERDGLLRARRQQPGVEFHLDVQQPCSLGDAGRHWGWQCRWYSTSTGLTQSRRREIEKALETTQRHLSTLTDWVLWTRDPLSKGDEEWLTALEAPFAIRHWDGQTVAGLLDGPARTLEQAYFGEHALTEHDLTTALREAIAPVRHRYERDLHVVTRPQRALGRWLLDDEYLTQLEREIEAAETGAKSIAQLLDDLAPHVPEQTVEGSHTSDESSERRPSGTQSEDVALLKDIMRLPEVLEAIRDAIKDGDLREAGRRSGEEAQRVEEAHAQLRQRLKGPGAPELASAVRFLADVRAVLACRAVAVVGGAGAGKTHLAVEVANGPTTGVLWLGAQFDRDIRIDSLAVETPLGPSTRDELLEALDAHAQRLGRRLPLIIDGLNESRDPRAWKDALARLAERLNDVSNLILVVTVRPSYAAETLPDDVARVELSGFEVEVHEAVRRYLEFYKIRVDTRQLPIDRFREPLFLRIFCEVANLERAPDVPLEHIPVSLSEVLERYVEQTVERISTPLDLDPAIARSAIESLAIEMWDSGKDRVLVTKARASVGDDGRPWSRSVLRALESEEVLIREPSRSEEVVTFAYDRLAGHLIARSIIQRDRVLPEVPESTHRLTEDVVVGLVGLMPIYRQTHLWPLLEGGRRTVALLELPGLPARHVGDPDSRTALAKVFEILPRRVVSALDRSMFIPDHPLNADFLSVLLTPRSLRQRDELWSLPSAGSWHALALSERWQSPWEDGFTTTSDHVAAQWLAWLLTSPDERTRQGAQGALRRYGRLHPRGIVDLALRSLTVNDPWLVHGLLGLAHEIAISDQREVCSDALRRLASRLRSAILTQPGDAATSDWLTRELARRIVSAAGLTVPRPPYPRPPDPRPISDPAVRLAVAKEMPKRVFETIASLAGSQHSDADSQAAAFIDFFAATLITLGWRPYSVAEGYDPLASKYSDQALLATAGRIEDFGTIHAAVSTLAPQLDGLGAPAERGLLGEGEQDSAAIS